MPVIISSISISCAQVQHQTLLSFRWDLRPPNKAFLILHAVPAGGWGIAIQFWSMKKNSYQIAKCRIQDERENTRLKDKCYVIHSDIHNWRCCTIDFIIDYFAVSFFSNEPCEVACIDWHVFFYLMYQSYTNQFAMLQPVLGTNVHSKILSLIVSARTHLFMLLNMNHLKNDFCLLRKIVMYLISIDINSFALSFFFRFISLTIVLENVNTSPSDHLVSLLVYLILQAISKNLSLRQNDKKKLAFSLVRALRLLALSCKVWFPQEACHQEIMTTLITALPVNFPYLDSSLYSHSLLSEFAPERVFIVSRRRKYLCFSFSW